MIVFDLICRDQHRFEGWFASADDFSSQKSRGLLECPVCGGAHVEKLPTARIRTQSEAPAPVETGAGQPRPTTQAEVSRRHRLHTHAQRGRGRNFAAEARRIYYQEGPQRSIRGVATRAETEDLREEGVPVFSLPVPPQDRWN